MSEDNNNSKIDIDKLAEEFNEFVKMTQKQIQEKIDQANKLLSEAEQIADENGVSFYSHISPLSQCYRANLNNLDKKFKDNLDLDTINDITKIYHYDDEYYSHGWTYSTVC